MYSDQSVGWPSRAFKCERKGTRIKNRVWYDVDSKAFLGRKYIFWMDTTELKIGDWNLLYNLEPCGPNNLGHEPWVAVSLRSFWRATTIRTYRSETVQVRSDNPLTQRSYLLVEPATYWGFFLLILRWFSLLHCFLFCSPGVLFPCAWQNCCGVGVALSMTLLLQTCCRALTWLQALEQSSWKRYNQTCVIKSLESGQFDAFCS